MRGRFVFALTTAALSGFVALSYEILWYRAFSFVSWSSPSAFGLLLGFYLLGVALGSLVARKFCKPMETSNGAELIPLAAFLALANAVGFVVIPLLAWLSTVEYAGTGTPDWPGHGESAWTLALVVVALSAALFGAVLPLVAHFAIPADHRAGARLSYVYLANIVGSALGSSFSGIVLMDHLSTRALSIAFLILGLALAAWAASLAEGKGRRAIFAATPFAAIVLVTSSPYLFSDLYERLLYKQTWKPEKRFVDVLENRHGVIAVSANGAVYGGGAYDGAFNVSLVDDKNGIERAFALSALHPHPKRVCVVGLSSGSWVQVIAHLPEVESVDVIEINSGYLDLIAKSSAIRSILRNPKVRMHVDDGRRWFRRHPSEKFDVLVMNTSIHWRAHATNVLSREFHELTREHMLPGAVSYFNATSSPEAERTAATVFPYAIRVVNFVAVSDTPITFDRERFAKVLRETRIDGAEPESLEKDAPLAWARFMELADSLLVEQDPSAAPRYALESRDHLLRRTAGVGVITDDNMLSEWTRSFWEFQGPPL